MNDKSKKNSFMLDLTPDQRKKIAESGQFDDVLDLLYEDSEYVESKKKKNDGMHDDFALLGLLQKENRRLNKLEKFLNDRLEVLKDTGHVDEINTRGQIKLKQIKDDAVEHFAKPDSTLLKNINEIWKKANS